MPVRKRYGIRSSLAIGRMNTPIQLGSGVSSAAAKKPVTLGTFIYLLIAVFGGAAIYQKSIIAQGGWIGKIIFAIGYIGLYASLMTRTPTWDYKLSYLLVYLKYFSPHGRRVETSLLDSGAELKNFMGIKAQGGVTKDGMVHFNDGEVGIFLDVIGNASAMIFAENQTAVIEDARNIYKNLPSGLGLTLITQASTQDVHRQVHSKLDQLHNLQLDDPGLRQIIKRQGQCLRDDIGSHFSMIRQYLLVRGKEDAALITAKTIIQAASSSTNNYLKSASVMTNEKLRLGRDRLPLNEPYQVETLLKSIFNDYSDRTDA